jgi:hypothetical protein
MRQPPQIAPPRSATASELEALSERCDYEGSVEHKEHRSWLGLPKLRKGDDLEDHRQTATICPFVTETERDVATRWVRMAVKNGQFDRDKWKGDFPRYLWYQDSEEHLWYAVLTNQGAGEASRGKYKGWPITAEEYREIFT